MEINQKDSSLLSIVSQCDNFPPGPPDPSYYHVYFPNDPQPHGYMLPETVAKMPWTDSFIIQHQHPREVRILDSSDGTDIAGAVNAALQNVVDLCIDQDVFHVFCRRHSELVTVVTAIYPTPVTIERYAAQLFGFVLRGVHLVAYVPGPDGLKIWVSRRAPSLYTYPDKLDVSVGGGLKSGSSPFQTVIEEAMEEASLSESTIRNCLRSTGTISHMGVTGHDFPGEKGLVLPDFIYMYDLELSPDIVLRPHDEEVAHFSLQSVPEVLHALRARAFKPDSSAAMVFFLIRHGFINPENEPDFVELTMRLHRSLPFRCRNV